MGHYTEYNLTALHFTI